MRRLRKGTGFSSVKGGTPQIRVPHPNLYSYLELESDDSPVDSNRPVLKPAGVFCMSSPFFVVEVESRQKRFEWANKLHREYFYMGDMWHFQRFC